MLALDPVTVAALIAWNANQQSERVFFETDYQNTDRVSRGRTADPCIQM
jgi:hypothetical protein